MAEYYPLLARAVASLRDGPAEKRRAIYDRARGALLNQLRSMQPAVPEEAITRESSALDEAIARLEAEIAAPPPVPEVPAAPAPTEPPPAQVSEPPPVETVSAPAAPPLRPAPEPERTEPVPPAPQIPPVATPPAPTVSTPVAPAPVAPAPVAPAAVPPTAAASAAAPLVSAVSPLAVDQPGPAALRSRSSGGPRPLTAPPRSTGSRPAAEALTRIIADQGQEPPVIRMPRPDEEGGLRNSNVTRVSAALPSAPKLQVQSFADAVVAAGAAATDGGEGRTGEGPAADAQPGRDEALRPAAPRPVVRETFNPRFIILAVIGALVVAGIAYTAWRLRDRPETLAQSRAALAAADQAASQQAGKISNRAEGGTAPAAASSPPATAVPQGGNAPSPAAVAPVPAAPSPAPDAATPAVAPAQPASTAPQPATPAPADKGAADSAATTAPAADSADIPVAQRAAFLVDAPDEPSKIKTYVGTVVWRSESVGTVQGQPLAAAVRAEVDIPEAGLKLTMLFQKNFEATFPASHTLDLRFSPAQDSPLGSVKQISVPQMRKDDSPSGESLVGLPVTITDNYFLVGLSRGDATAHNLDLIASRNWFDIPVLMSSGKVAKVTFEKGATGQKIFASVMQSWQ